MAEDAGDRQVHDHQGDRQGRKDQPVLRLTRAPADAARAGDCGGDSGWTRGSSADTGGGDGGVSVRFDHCAVVQFGQD